MAPPPPEVPEIEPAPSQAAQRDACRPAGDLGAVRPAAEGDRPSTRSAIIDGPHAEPRQFAARIEPQPLPSLHTAVRRQQILRGLRSGWTLLGTRPALLAAGLAGALLFAATTGFGRNVRPSQSLSLGLDRMLVAAGLGINEIAVSGHRHTLDQDIFRVLGAGRSSLLFFDVGAARQRLEALPWIDSASLIRVLPDKLKVEVRERRPAAAWLDGDRVALVDLTGRLLAYVATFVPPELPRIAGPGAPEAAAELISALARFPEIAARVHVAHRIGQRRWDLELTGGTRILMAAGPSLPSLQRLVELNHETQVLEQANQVVDLTMSRSIAVSDPTPADAAGRRPGARLPPARPL